MAMCMTSTAIASSEHMRERTKVKSTVFGLPSLDQGNTETAESPMPD